MEEENSNDDDDVVDDAKWGEKQFFFVAGGPPYLGTPRIGSGVADEFLTTPELFTFAGDTILLGWPWW